jgi:hypothetical protein
MPSIVVDRYGDVLIQTLSQVPEQVKPVLAGIVARTVSAEGHHRSATTARCERWKDCPDDFDSSWRQIPERLSAARMAAILTISY